MSVIQSQVLIGMLQEQLTFERFSADVYYGLGAHLDDLNLVGMAKYLYRRRDEERGHAQKFTDYLSDRFIRPQIAALPDPSRPLPGDVMAAGRAAFSTALEHERIVTSRIRALYDAAYEENDPETVAFILPFLTEQVEEEKSLDEILTRFRLAEGNGAAILMIDHELGG